MRDGMRTDYHYDISSACFTESIFVSASVDGLFFAKLWNATKNLYAHWSIPCWEIQKFSSIFIGGEYWQNRMRSQKSKRTFCRNLSLLFKTLHKLRKRGPDPWLQGQDEIFTLIQCLRKLTISQTINTAELLVRTQHVIKRSLPRQSHDLCAAVSCDAFVLFSMCGNTASLLMFLAENLSRRKSRFNIQVLLCNQKWFWTETLYVKKMNNNTCLIRMDNENHFETTKMTSSIHSPFSWWGRRWTRSSSKLEQSESFAGAFFSNLWSLGSGELRTPSRLRRSLSEQWSAPI